ncbi:MAG: imidazole glycerol phosphate synthase subunit HisH [Candidatus Gastranaerophilales bacterium]|nr:imidazole glycerol phosphate synthase subunit HisH [Candidatus Gastranaerophilales bacterium]
MNTKVSIIDYGAGNVASIGNMLHFLGVDYEITSDKEKIMRSERVIFPGQGHFAQAMEKLKQNDLVSFLQDLTASGKEFLGICLGLQVLFEKSEEAPGVEGLKIFKGEVIKFQKGKIPQIGWNEIKVTSANTLLDNEFYYFVNSYFVKPENSNIISSYANYHIDFAASVQYKNITAVQFHPEKSSNAGVKFYKNWLNKGK